MDSKYFTVRDGAAAVEALEKQPFDVMLMDIHMPEMDGFEATARIREKEESLGGHIPIIALTANALKGDQDRCRAASMDAYISKPIRRGELEAIGNILARKEAQEPKEVTRSQG